MVKLQEFANDLRNDFICCPVCFASAKGTFTARITNGEQDTLICRMCGAKWDLYIMPLRGLEWAELISTAQDGRGKEFLGKKLSKKEIRTITQKEDSEQNKATFKEIIKEKEVITRVRCHYCHSSFDESLDKCPNCGAKK
jgi:hypothetical protein